jgi:hypothetical protein
METAAKRRLGDIVVERGLITNDQLQQALDHQRQTGGKLGEILVELGLLTRMALAGVLSEQWDQLRLTESGRKTAETGARRGTVVAPTAVEIALRERLEALTEELAKRDERIVQQDATIAALLRRLSSETLGGAAA